MPIHTTACPRNCYCTCSLRVEVEDGRLVRVEPHPGNAATSEGACLKGLSYVERVVSPDRLLTPLARVKGSDSFERITWDDALDRIALELIKLKERFGPQSILYYQGSGTKGLLNRVGPAFWRLFGGYTTTYGDLCWPAGLEATRLTLGENKHSDPWEIANANLIILWGKNSAETNLHEMPLITRALDRGGRLVVIDPRRTESAERAEWLIQPRPGTDGALALGIAHLIIRNDLVDTSFVEKHVEGYREFAGLVDDFPPERAAAIAGVPAGSIERLAEMIGTIKPVTICAGFGMQRYTNSGQTMRAILALLAITGNIGRRGAGWQFANLQSSVFDRVADPIAFYPPERGDGVARISISTARLGSDMLETLDPPVKMIWVERGNPVNQNPDTGEILEAFRELDFRVVVEQFMTDTARQADIVLPAKSMFEQSDVIGAYWHPYIQLKQKVLDPPGEVKPESAIYTLLARRLGIPDDAVAERIPGPSDADVDAWLERQLAPFPEMSLKELRRGPVLAPGHQEIAFSDFVFPTPSGKIELLSNEAKERWGVDPLPSYREPAESAWRHSVEADDPTQHRRSEDDRHPLHLMTPNTKNSIHSQFNNLRSIRAVSGPPRAAIHPRDAYPRGIRDGDRVKIRNDRGSFELEARLDLGLRPGCVTVTNGWWASDGANVNFCSLGRETDMGHGAAFHDNLVEVERAT